MTIRIETPEEHEAVGKILDALHFKYLDFDYSSTKFSAWTKGAELPFAVHVFQSTYREFNVLRRNVSSDMPAREFIKKPINYALLKIREEKKCR